MLIIFCQNKLKANCEKRPKKLHKVQFNNSWSWKSIPSFRWLRNLKKSQIVANFYPLKLTSFQLELLILAWVQFVHLFNLCAYFWWLDFLLPLNFFSRETSWQDKISFDFLLNVKCICYFSFIWIIWFEKHLSVKEKKTLNFLFTFSVLRNSLPLLPLFLLFREMKVLKTSVFSNTHFQFSHPSTCTDSQIKATLSNERQKNF